MSMLGSVLLQWFHLNGKVKGNIWHQQEMSLGFLTGLLYKAHISNQYKVKSGYLYGGRSFLGSYLKPTKDPQMVISYRVVIQRQILEPLLNGILVCPCRDKFFCNAFSLVERLKVKSGWTRASKLMFSYRFVVYSTHLQSVQREIRVLISHKQWFNLVGKF